MCNSMRKNVYVYSRAPTALPLDLSSYIVSTLA